MTVQEAITAAELLLPGVPAPEGTEDPRWQAIIQIGVFAEREPVLIWPFVLKWGSHEDEDVRAAIATCLLEHLLEYHFDVIFASAESAARSNAFFRDTLKQCWKFGQAKEPDRAERFDCLLAEFRKSGS
jgi:hypothetical protein